MPPTLNLQARPESIHVIYTSKSSYISPASIIMNPRGISFILFIGLIAVLSSNQFRNLPLLILEYVNDHIILEMLSSTGIPILISYHEFVYKRNHHHHHHDDQKRKVVSICDDFPPDFPPPDTNTTSMICVDHNGCCNFTTVQAAVDAVGVLSSKRTIIWINSGIYL